MEEGDGEWGECVSYFLEELCLYVGNQTSSDGEDTTR